MNSKFFLFVATLLAYGLYMGKAQAIIGNSSVTSPSESDYSYVCQISINGSFDDGGSVCSGTLIDSTRVLTAGHCFGQDFSVRSSAVDVSCGGRGMSSVTNLSIAAGTDASLWLNEQEPARAADFAILTLKNPATKNSFENYASSASKYFTDEGPLKDGVTCSILGYGIDNRGSVGTLHQVILKPTEASVFYNKYLNLVYISPVGSDYLKNSVDKGDSGGPLLCNLPGAATELIGTAVMFQFDGNQSYRKTNVFNPIWAHLSSSGATIDGTIAAPMSPRESIPHDLSTF